MKYDDKITMIQRGGSGRYGKIPDKVIDVIFLKMANEDGKFEFLYPNDVLRRVGQGNVNDIITVNGVASS